MNDKDDGWNELADDDVKIAWYDNKLAEQKQATAAAMRRAEEAEQRAADAEAETASLYTQLGNVERFSANASVEVDELIVERDACCARAEAAEAAGAALAERDVELSALRAVATAGQTLAQMVRNVYLPDGQPISGPALAVDAAVNDFGWSLVALAAVHCGGDAQQGDKGQ